MKLDRDQIITILRIAQGQHSCVATSCGRCSLYRANPPDPLAVCSRISMEFKAEYNRSGLVITVYQAYIDNHPEIFSSENIAEAML